MALALMQKRMEDEIKAFQSMQKGARGGGAAGGSGGGG